jgi:hypothetical protein
VYRKGEEDKKKDDHKQRKENVSVLARDPIQSMRDPGHTYFFPHCRVPYYRRSSPHTETSGLDSQ